MTHELQDRVSLEMARRVAERLRRSPALLEVARQNLARWSRRNADSPPLVRCYREWQEILETRSLEEVCRILSDTSDQGQRLRQNSPFVGILPPAEVWAIKRHLRHEATRA